MAVMEMVSTTEEKKKVTINNIEGEVNTNVNDEENEENVSDEEVMKIIDDLNEIENEESDTYDFDDNEKLSVSNDIVRDYLRQIGKIPVLTREQEHDLGTKVQNGLKAKEELDLINKGELISNEQHLRELNDTIAEGDYARKELVEHSLKLAASIALRYTTTKCEGMDLIQEGNLGLMQAAEKFNPELGFKFSTYATWWIKQHVTRYIMNTGNTIRIPVHAMEVVLKIGKIKREMLLQEGREPSIEEIAEKVGMDKKKVEELLLRATDPVSMESEVSKADSDSDTTLGEMIPDEHIETPEQSFYKTDLRDEMRKVLDNSKLSAREKDVIKKRFGLDTDGATMTLEEIGVQYNVTRERIRQIEAKALRKLRHPKYKSILLAYTES